MSINDAFKPNNIPTLFDYDEPSMEISEQKFDLEARDRELEIREIGRCGCADVYIANIGDSVISGKELAPGASVNIVDRNRALAQILDSYAAENSNHGFVYQVNSPKPKDEIIKRYGSVEAAKGIAEGGSKNVNNAAIRAESLWNIAYGSNSLDEHGLMKGTEATGNARDESFMHRLKFAGTSPENISLRNIERAKLKKQATAYRRLQEKLEDSR